MHFNGFMTSSVCVHEIMEHADDVSKLVGWSNVTVTLCLFYNAKCHIIFC